MTHPHTLSAVRAALASALIFGLAACADSPATTETAEGEPVAAASKLSGQVRIDGSSTVAPLTGVAAELFGEQNPSVQVPVATSGTGGGFEKFCRGETDIANASRAIKDAEKQACQTAGITYQEFQVANDALTVVVNKDNNWVDCITVDQLKKIWEPGSTVSSWNQVDPSWPNEPMKLFGAGTDSGTFDYFTKEINGEEGASRTDYNPTEDDNVTVTGVSGSKGGLGYFGFSYFEENASKLKALKVDDDGGCVEPSVTSAQDGSYKPLARPLYIYLAGKSLTRPEVRGFVEYYVANHTKIAEEAKFVPLNATQEATLKQNYEKFESGQA